MMIIMVLGLPGSGKSYFARKLADKLDCIYLSSDEIRQEIGKRGFYTEDNKAIVYEKMQNRIAKHLGKNIILDATFYKKQLREKFYAEAEKNSQTLFIIRVWANENLIKERTSVKREHSDANFETYLKIKNGFEPLEKSYLDLESTNNNLEEMLQKACKYLKL